MEATPQNFPKNIPVSLQNFQNWEGTINAENLLTATATCQQDIVTLSNWAFLNGYKIRPLGKMHNWSPLTITSGHGDHSHPTLLVDTTKHLTKIKMVKSLNAVQVETGATIESVLGYLETKGLSLYAVPACGDLSLGGVLAIGGHGTGIVTQHSPLSKGHSSGCLSSTVVKLNAVVWDEKQKKYVLKTFTRKDDDFSIFVVHLGRAFVTKVIIEVGQNYKLQCTSLTSALSTEHLFDAPSKSLPSNGLLKSGPNMHTISDYLLKYGRIEVISFPFSQSSWLKYWKVVEGKPNNCFETNSPYNFTFCDHIPKAFLEYFESYLKSSIYAAKTFGPLQMAAVRAGFSATSTSNIWGNSKNTLLYVKKTTLKQTASGYAILCRRDKVQQLLHLVKEDFDAQLKEFGEQGLYPITGGLDIRVTELDGQNEVIPELSAIRPVKGRQDLDTAIWLDLLSAPGLEGQFKFMEQFETTLILKSKELDIIIRPEWSKGWAYTEKGPWTNQHFLKTYIPNLFKENEASDLKDWNGIISRLNYYDPHHIFSNEFLEKFMQKCEV